MREISLDTETTGLNPGSGHRIVEIGCVEMQGRIKTGKFYHIYLNPERDMPEEAYRVHGISAEFLRDKPLFATEADAFLKFLGDAPLVIHNAAFDMKFINTELERVGREAIPMERTIDTVPMARKKFPGSPANLDALCRRFEIDLSARSKHGALLDAELLADVYLELTGGRQAVMALLEEQAAENAAALKPGNKEIAPREFPVSEAELVAHREFLKQVSDPIWEQV